MTTAQKATTIGFLIFITGTALGFAVRHQIALQHGRAFGEIITSICANEGYAGALFPLSDPDQARCMSEDESAELKAVNNL
jgi:hypothetical protein